VGLRVRWVLDGLVFNDAPDPDGTEYVITAETGWSSSPPTRTTSTDRTGAHGAYPAPVWSAARIIDLTGKAFASSWEARRRAEHRLAALASDPARLVELRCTEETGDLTAMVARADQTQVAIDPGGYSLSFALALRAPDPRKYADPRTTDGGLPLETSGLDFETGGGLDYETKGGLDFGTTTGLGRAVAANPGTADCAPLLGLFGPLTAPITITRTDTGATLTYLDSIPNGQFVTIDTAARTVLLGGATQRRHRAIVPDWDALTIPPGGRAEYALTHNDTPNPTARLHVSWRPAWW
jgi:hypothetical protein